MVDELVDIYDEHNNFTGIKKLKSEAHKKGLWHRSAQVWIYNSKGEILIQLRSKDKTLCPDMWDISVAGHMSPGEEPIVSALREVKEEIGLNLKEKNLEFVKIRKNSLVFAKLINNEHSYVYLYQFNKKINALKLQKDELQDVRFIAAEKLAIDIKNHPESYVPLFDYWHEMIDKVRKRIKIK